MITILSVLAIVLGVIAIVQGLRTNKVLSKLDEASAAIEMTTERLERYTTLKAAVQFDWEKIFTVPFDIRK